MKPLMLTAAIPFSEFVRDVARADLRVHYLLAIRRIHGLDWYMFTNAAVDATGQELQGTGRTCIAPDELVQGWLRVEPCYTL